MIVKTARAPVTATLSVEEYIVLEEAQLERRFEYIDGELYEMPGGTSYHDDIRWNLIFVLYPQLLDSDCKFHSSDMRVRISDTRYVYPDLTLVCGGSRYDNNNTTLLNPVLAVEITSPNSLVYDRVDKRDFYTAVPSMQAYLVIDQHRIFAELHTRDGQRWLRDEFDSLGDVIEIEALGCRLPLSAIYRHITFSSA